MHARDFHRFLLGITLVLYLRYGHHSGGVEPKQAIKRKATGSSGGKDGMGRGNGTWRENSLGKQERSVFLSQLYTYQVCGFRFAT